VVVVEVVVEVVDLYSASHSASNALLILLRCEEMSFQRRSEAVVLRAGSRTESGSEFHSIGPATEKARRPNVLRRCRGTINVWRLADLRCWRLEMSEVREQQSIRYWWEPLCWRRRWTVNADSLSVTLSVTEAKYSAYAKPLPFLPVMVNEDEYLQTNLETDKNQKNY